MQLVSQAYAPACVSAIVGVVDPIVRNVCVVLCCDNDTALVCMPCNCVYTCMCVAHLLSDSHECVCVLHVLVMVTCGDTCVCACEGVW